MRRVTLETSHTHDDIYDKSDQPTEEQIEADQRETAFHDKVATCSI